MTHFKTDDLIGFPLFDSSTTSQNLYDLVQQEIRQFFQEKKKNKIQTTF